MKNKLHFLLLFKQGMQLNSLIPHCKIHLLVVINFNFEGEIKTIKLI